MDRPLFCCEKTHIYWKDKMLIKEFLSKLRLFVLACLTLGLAAMPLQAGYISGPVSEDFTFFTTPTKWEPGTNTATIFTPPPNPMSLGGATWSIMGAGFSDDFNSGGGHGGNSTSLITALGVSGFALADYEALFDVALNVWASASGFTNLGQVADGGGPPSVNAGATEASGGHLGDIRIAAWELKKPTTLAHAFQPGSEAIFGSGGTITGDVHFDVTRTWADDPTDTIADSDFDLFTVAVHELGHSLGLGHSTVSGSVMEPVYAGARRTLMADDIAGIIALYGAAIEPIPEPCTMTLLGIGIFGMFGYGWRRRKLSTKECLSL